VFAALTAQFAMAEGLAHQMHGMSFPVATRTSRWKPALTTCRARPCGRSRQVKAAEQRVLRLLGPLTGSLKHHVFAVARLGVLADGLLPSAQRQVHINGT
jgi:hypothetical protein